LIRIKAAAAAYSNLPPDFGRPAVRSIKLTPRPMADGPVNIALLVGSVLTVLAAGGAPVMAATGPDAAAGRIVAQRACGGCHAVAEGPSPLAVAPPFRTLRSRGAIDALLERGMLADHPPSLEEGRRPPHPDMPQVTLGPDEVAHLKTYLHALNDRD
jgi:hypothetical protein